MSHDKPAMAAPLLGSLHLGGSDLRFSWEVHSQACQDLVVFDPLLVETPHIMNRESRASEIAALFALQQRQI